MPHLSFKCLSRGPSSQHMFQQLLIAKRTFNYSCSICLDIPCSLFLKKKKTNPGVLPLYMVLPGRVAQRYLCSQTPQVYLVVSILPFCQTVPQEGAGIGLRHRCFPFQGTHPSSVLMLYLQSCPKDSFIKNFFVEIQFTYIKVHKSQVYSLIRFDKCL